MDKEDLVHGSKVPRICPCPLGALSMGTRRFRGLGLAGGFGLPALCNATFAMMRPSIWEATELFFDLLALKEQKDSVTSF